MRDVALRMSNPCGCLYRRGSLKPTNPLRRTNRFLQRHWWTGLAFVCLGVGLGIVGELLDEDTPSRTEIVTNQSGEQLVVEHRGGSNNAVFLVLAGIGVGIYGTILLILWDQKRPGKLPSRRRKIEELSKSLRDALTTIDLIKHDVEEGQRVLAELEQDVSVKSQLAQLHAKDAEAVLAQLQITVRSESTRSTWVQFGINLGFFLLGIAVTLLLAG